MGAVEEARGAGQGGVIPLHARFHSQGAPIVGTELEYFRVSRTAAGRGALVHTAG